MPTCIRAKKYSAKACELTAHYILVFAHTWSNVNAILPTPNITLVLRTNQKG